MHGTNSEENRKNQAEYYDEYVDRQQSVGINARHQSIIDKLVHHGLKRTDNTLEIGCGIGTFSGLLGKYLTDAMALCIDISAKSVELASKEYRTLTNLRFLTANAVSYDFGDSKFDAIILPDVLEHIPLDQHPVLFKKLTSILSTNGTIYIHIPNPYYLEWCHANHPELLQIIDQPIYTHTLIESIKPSGLHIHYLETYSIWVRDCDYQFIILKQTGQENFSQLLEEKVTLLDKVKYKLDGWRKK